MAGPATKTTQELVELILADDARARAAQQAVELLMEPGHTSADSDFETDVLADTPKAYWKLQDAIGLPVDSSGNGLDMTTLVGTDIRPRQPGQLYLADYSYYLGGSSALRRTTQVSTVTDNFTIELAVRLNAVLANDSQLFHNGTVSTNGWGVVIDTNGKFQYLASGVAFGASSSATLTTTSLDFTLIHVVLDAGTWKYYVNGAVDTANAGTSAPIAPSGTAQINHSAATVLGCYYHHVAVFESVLSPTTISDRYALFVNAAGEAAASQYVTELLMSEGNPDVHVSDYVLEMLHLADLDVATLSSGTVGFGGAV